MATTCKLIQKIVLGSNAADITFSDIPSTYTDLYIVASARTTRNDAGVLALRFNGSTTGYSNRFLEGNGSSAASYTDTDAIIVCGATSTSNTFGSVEIYIPNYAGSTNKSASITSVQETNASGAFIRAHAFLWSNTAAITSVKIQDNTSTNIVSGSAFFLYGITKA